MGYAALLRNYNIDIRITTLNRNTATTWKQFNTLYSGFGCFMWDNPGPALQVTDYINIIETEDNYFNKAGIVNHGLPKITCNPFIGRLK